MTFKEIQELVRIFSKSGIGELNIEKENFKIKLKSVEGVVKVTNTPAQMMPQTTVMPTSISSAPAPIPSQESVKNSESESKSNSDSSSGNQIVIKSPMIGTFYRASGPDKDPFVKVGDRVEVGQTLCIIEAMKLFNEIESEFSGTVVKILVNDASPIEYDQPLLILEP